MFYTTKVLINFASHRSHISVNGTGTIHVFKYNNQTCDFGVFQDQFEASDYIMSPLASHTYRVHFPGESD